MLNAFEYALGFNKVDNTLQEIVGDYGEYDDEYDKFWDISFDCFEEEDNHEEELDYSNPKKLIKQLKKMEKGLAKQEEESEKSYKGNYNFERHYAFRLWKKKKDVNIQKAIDDIKHYSENIPTYYQMAYFNYDDDKINQELKLMMNEYT